MTADRNSRAESLAIAALVVVGLSLRIAGTGTYGLNLDEAQFVWVASCETLWDVARYVFAESPHPPAHFLLVHLLLRVSRGLFWLRLPSVLAGTFVIWASWRLGRQLLGTAAGVTVAVMVTFSPALVDLSRVCRNYAPGLAFMVPALWLLVRYLRDGRRRDLIGFAALELLATLFAYAFVIVFAAANVALGVTLLLRRASLRTWLETVGVQLPFAIVMGLLYTRHITALPPAVVMFHEAMYRERLGLQLAAPLRPLREVWEFLVPEGFAAPLFWLGLAGLGALAWAREGLVALLLTTPIVLAYLAMAAGKLPLGASRHSAYLFPSLFGLAGAAVAALVRARESARTWVRRIAEVSLFLALAGAAGFAAASLREYARVAEFIPYAPRQRELLTYYRQADVDRAFAILRERVGEHDFVMLTIQGVWTVRVQLATVPLLDPTPSEQAARDLRWALAPRGPYQYVDGRVHYYMSPVGFMFTPDSLAQAVRDVRRHFGLGPPPRVWVIRTGWERPLAPLLEERHPGVPVDLGVHRETNGVLFAVDGMALDRLAAP